MYSGKDLLGFLPSKHQETLAKAIGRPLVEVERFFLLTPQNLLQNSHLRKVDFFSYNSGAVQLWFEGNLNHALAVYGEHLSIVLLPETFQETEFDKQYRLSEIDEQLASESLRDCLGEICQDVRIWTLQEEFKSVEAKEAGISYLLSNGQELFYCIYLHGDLSSDYLLVDLVIHQEKVASCFSLSLGEYIEPYISNKSTAQSFAD